MQFKHFDIGYEYSPMFRNVRGDFSHVQAAYHRNKNGLGKVLIVLDYMPSEDISSGQLLSGDTGKLLKRLLFNANNFYREENTIDDFDWVAIAYNSFKTKDKAQTFVAAAEAEFLKRLKTVIMKYKPDIVLTFGHAPYRALNDAKIKQYDGKHQHLYGQAIATKVKFSGETHKFLHVPTISLQTMINTDYKGGAISIAGYVSRNLTTVLRAGKARYLMPRDPEYTVELVDTIKKFDKMLDYLRKQKEVAIDTETENLYRRKNRMLTIQFAAKKDHAYVLPFYHKDSPFDGKELNYISNKLRNFFECDNKNRYHVFANGPFDLTVIRNAIGVRYFKAPAWDIFAGEYILDENMKFLSATTGGYYYSLGNLVMQYGCDVYYRSEFGKDKRKTIWQVDLDEKLITYCALDVITLLYIKKLQLRRASDIGHEKYELMVGAQMSDTVHTISTLEYNGSRIDIEYLFHLKSEESPIVKELHRTRKVLNESKAVQKANRILCKDKAVPQLGLMGKANVQMFDIGKKKHKQLLFFNILGLKPVSFGKDGEGKIDKHFQAEHKEVEEVAMFTAMVKIKKLYDAYVKSFIKQWGSDDDMRFDTRIRPHFGYLPVVTGRLSATKPSLHQIPSRSEAGKHIKRLFVAAPGRIILKVDYSAHEVRCWSIITGDKEVAKVFKIGYDLRKKYRYSPSSSLAERIKLEGDVHKINASYFFGVDITAVTKSIRDAVKTVIFGLIYQQGFKGLAASTGRKLEEIEDIVGQFLARFPVGVKWFDQMKKFARKNLYVESPIGRRRYLWGYLLPKSVEIADQVYHSMDRRAVNSPVQGIGSDFLVTGSRQIERLKYKHFMKTGHYPDFYQGNQVHDAIEFSCAYEDVWLAISIIENGLTRAVAKETMKRHGIKFTIPLEIEFEIGAHLKGCDAWDYALDGSKGSFKTLVMEALNTQKDELGYDVNPKKTYKSIMANLHQGPKWAREQEEYIDDMEKKAA